MYRSTLASTERVGQHDLVSPLGRRGGSSWGPTPFRANTGPHPWPQLSWRGCAPTREGGRFRLASPNVGIVCYTSDEPKSFRRRVCLKSLYIDCNVEMCAFFPPYSLAGMESESSFCSTTPRFESHASSSIISCIRLSVAGAQPVSAPFRSPLASFLRTDLPCYPTSSPVRRPLCCR